ncbi:MAG: cbb3-type cytochrome c oxidase subunit 3 [Alphaproteobacteria bacterium]|nr:cbb3-type cytochrome c oxidase subunit 3 [Alphaproteobacteria bacterium]
MDMMEIYSLLRSLWVVWFMALFLGIVAWALWPANRRRFEDHGQIPLRDDR